MTRRGVLAPAESADGALEPRAKAPCLDKTLFWHLILSVCERTGPGPPCPRRLSHARGIPRSGCSGALHCRCTPCAIGIAMSTRPRDCQLLLPTTTSKRQRSTMGPTRTWFGWCFMGSSGDRGTPIPPPPWLTLKGARPPACPPATPPHHTRRYAPKALTHPLDLNKVVAKVCSFRSAPARHARAGTPQSRHGCLAGERVAAAAGHAAADTPDTLGAPRKNSPGRAGRPRWQAWVAAADTAGAPPKNPGRPHWQALDRDHMRSLVAYDRRVRLPAPTPPRPHPQMQRACVSANCWVSFLPFRCWFERHVSSPPPHRANSAT